MLSSRPKRICKSLANEVLVLLDEENNDEDIFEDATSTDEDEEEEGGYLPQEDDLLAVDQLEVISSESEFSDEEEPEMDDASFVSTSGRIWHLRNPVVMQGRQPARNIYRVRQGAAPGVNPQTEGEAILMFLSQSLQITLQFSNLEGRRRVVIWNRNHPTMKKRFVPISMPELEAFVGLLILLGRAQFSLY